jgi:hypothetical protein
MNFDSLWLLFSAGYILLMVLFVFSWQKGKSVQERQMIATGSGILGTFLGIFIALLNFDTGNITSSVPELLDGMKIAFVTSIAGMMMSLILGISSKKEEGGDSEKTEKQVLVDVLQEVRTLNANIAGDNDTTLITQVQKLRTSINDKQDELKKSFDDFAEKMAKDTTEEVMKAVEKVMKDFNAKINDQLGENFKRLGDAAENLVIWQDQYRVQIKDAVAALQEANKALGVSVEGISTLTEQAGHFEKISKQLKEALETMGTTMVGIKNLGDTLDDSGKKIRDEMSELTRQNITELGENLKGISEKLVEDYSYLQKMMQTVIDDKK